MSHETNCTFCESLPAVARRSWGGRPSKCPLCKQELWVSQSGATCRIDATLPSGAKMRWVAGVSAAIVVCVLSTLGLVAFKFTQKVNTEQPTPNVELAAVPNQQPAPEIAGPSVYAKPSMSPDGARAKPTAQRAEVPQQAAAPVAKAVVKADTQASDRPPVVSKSATPGSLAFKVRHQLPTLELEAMLDKVPVIDLDPDYLNRSKSEIADKAKEIVKENKDSKDGFVKKLVQDRQDLAGLPFLMGKDCLLDNKEAQALGAASLNIRRAMADAHDYEGRSRKNSQTSPSESSYFRPTSDRIAAHFWSARSMYVSARDGLQPDSLRAFHQILSAESMEFRIGLIANLEKTTDAKATEILVNRAVFDLDPDIRHAALALLASRPPREYADALKKGLRYPWLPVVQNAADAIATLNRKEMVPDLVALLDEPDPRKPFTVKDKDGKEKTMVREMVRINHHRNCMLCHPAVDSANKQEMTELRRLPVGPAPTPQEPLPPSSSTVYYSVRPGVTIVRADVTYLRQDFSLHQAVADSGKWPAKQRFDFLVRTRELTPKEIALQPEVVQHTDYRELIAGTLRMLTSRDAAANSKAWRQALAMP